MAGGKGRAERLDVIFLGVSVPFSVGAINRALIPCGFRSQLLIPCAKRQQLDQSFVGRDEC
jgi:hypothetical protein